MDMCITLALFYANGLNFNFFKFSFYFNLLRTLSMSMIIPFFSFKFIGKTVQKDKRKWRLQNDNIAIICTNGELFQFQFFLINSV